MPPPVDGALDSETPLSESEGHGALIARRGVAVHALDASGDDSEEQGIMDMDSFIELYTGVQALEIPDT